MQKDNLKNIKPRLLSSLAGFTLIELLIVIGLLGVLASLVLSSLQVQRTDVLDNSLAPAEMMDICKAFVAFEADCVPTSTDRTLIEQYGLEILMDYESSRGWSFPDEFDFDRGKGWRGPYIERQGSREVNTVSGQPLLSGGTDLPVVHDPYSDLPDDEHYYRVIKPAAETKLKLVFIGSDGALGTADDVERVLLTW